jgi:hypothetical protein
LIPSGKPTKNDGKSPFLMGKLWKITIFNGKPTKNLWKDPSCEIGNSTTNGKFAIAMLNHVKSENCHNCTIKCSVAM